MQCFWSFPLLVSPVQSHMYRIQKRSRTVPYHGGAELPQRIEGERGVEPSQLPAFSSGTALGTTRQETSRFTPIPAFSLLPWDNTRSMRGRMTYQQAPCILAVVNPSARQLGPSWHGCYHRGTQSRDCSSQEQEGGEKGSWRSWRWSNRRVSNAAACAPPPPFGGRGCPPPRPAALGETSGWGSLDHDALKRDQDREPTAYILWGVGASRQEEFLPFNSSMSGWKEAGDKAARPSRVGGCEFVSTP